MCHPPGTDIPSSRAESGSGLSPGVTSFHGPALATSGVIDKLRVRLLDFVDEDLGVNDIHITEMSEAASNCSLETIQDVVYSYMSVEDPEATKAAVQDRRLVAYMYLRTIGPFWIPTLLLARASYRAKLQHTCSHPKPSRRNGNAGPMNRTGSELVITSAQSGRPYLTRLPVAAPLPLNFFKA